MKKRVINYAIKIRIYLILLLILLSNSLISCAEQPLKILFLGNSITKHLPRKSIGWEGNWGMAASDQNKDYVHQILVKLKKKPVEYKIENVVGSFENKYWDIDTLDFKLLKEFEADIIVISIGENIPAKNIKDHSLDSGLKKLVNYLSGDKSPRILVVGSFWPNPIFENALISSAKSNGWLYVNIGNIYKYGAETTAFGKYSNSAVAKHPSDKGMKLIAKRIWKELKSII